MAKTYNKMQIDMNGDILSSVTAVAQDTLSRYLDCNLYNNGLPIDLTGHMAQLYVKKPEPDGLQVFTQGEITDATAGRVQFELTNQALAETGWIELQIVLTSGEGEVLSSEIFKLHVLPSIRNDEAIESTNEFGALVVLFQEIHSALDAMNAIATNFGNPGEVAEEYGATSFWEMLEAVIGNVDAVNAIKKYVNSSMGTDYFMPISKMISSVSGTAGFVPLDLLLKAVIGSSVTFTEDGSFVVPDGVTEVRITAAAGGGGGGGDWYYTAGSGGGGGECVVKKSFSVTPGATIPITIGKGGEGAIYAEAGTRGGNTVVGNLLTLNGGNGGLSGLQTDSGIAGTVEGGAAGGTGGGKGGDGCSNGYGKDGEPGAVGLGGKGGYGKIKTGTKDNPGGGGGGGGSYGAGGDAGDSEGAAPNPGSFGGGGGGLSAHSESERGAKGGDGIVIIEWGAA